VEQLNWALVPLQELKVHARVVLPCVSVPIAAAFGTLYVQFNGAVPLEPVQEGARTRILVAWTGHAMSPCKPVVPPS